jgi:hypothetical protein
MMATLAAAEDPPFLAVKALLLNPENPEAWVSQYQFAGDIAG